MTDLLTRTTRRTFGVLLGALLAILVTMAVPLSLQAQGGGGRPTGGSTQGTLGAGNVLLGFGEPGATVLKVVRTQLTDAQMKALLTTAVTVVPAQGAGFLSEVLGGMIVFDYAGAYTETGGNDNLRLYYRTSGDEVASNAIEMTGFIDSTADAIIRFGPLPNDTVIKGTELSNQPIVLSALNDGNYHNLGGGNAANKITVHVLVRVLRTEL